MSQFQVRRDDFSKLRLVENTEQATIKEGDILVKVNRFAFTANNITYAAAGDRIGYWKFFPPLGQNTDGWGVIPVWGFAEVIESKNEEFKLGERIFGYFPPADTLSLSPAKTSATQFFDATEHRAELPPAYNSYRRVEAEAGYDASLDNERMLLWPLFITSFCLWDSLQVNDWYGAEQVIVISASSKTSIGMAYAINDDKNAPELIGITSPRNRELVDSLGLYNKSFSYDDIANIDASKPAVIVDMSGNGEVLATLHQHLGDNMKFCSNVGITHWDASGKEEGFISERSEMFFAPSHIQMRIKDWGADGFNQKTATFITETMLKSRSWLKLRTLDGLSELSDVYPAVCDGKIAADEGLIVEM